MKNNEEVVGKLYAVVRALDAITISGKNNLANLVGSIGTIEEVIQMLQKSDSDKNGDE